MIEGFASVSTFGRRKMTPSACICDSNRHVRTFLCDALEELGYIVRESTEADELSGHLDERPFDLVVIGLSGGGVLANEFLTALTVRHYAGKVLVVGRPDSPMVKAVEELGGTLGLVMLPLLATPYREENLRHILAALPPAEAPPSPRSMSRRRCTPAGLNCGTNRRSTCGRSFRAVPRPLSESVIRLGESFHPRISSRITAIRISAGCPNLSSARQSSIGTILSNSTEMSRSRSIFRLPSLATPKRSPKYIADCRNIRHSRE